MSGLIDDYLNELKGLLPRVVRRDVADEVEDHLRESASMHGEEAAVSRFGAARDIARASAGRAAMHYLRRAAVLLVLAAVPFGLAAFPLPTDLIPAWGATPFDRWPQEDVQVAGQQDAILVLFCVSVALVVLGVLLSVLRWRRIGLMLHAGSLTAIVALGVTVTVLSVRWQRALPVAPSYLWIVLYACLGALALAAAAWLIVGAGRANARLRGETI